MLQIFIYQDFKIPKTENNIIFGFHYESHIQLQQDSFAFSISKSNIIFSFRTRTRVVQDFTDNINLTVGFPFISPYFLHDLVLD